MGFVVLGSIHGGISHTVNNDGDTVVGNHPFHGCFVGDVEHGDVVACHIGKNGIEALVIGQHVTHLVP